MPRYLFVGQSSPLPGQESAFNDWYVNQHLPEFIKSKGIVSVRRFKIASSQIPNVPTPHDFLTLFDIETDTPQAFLEDMMGRAKQGLIPSSKTLALNSSGLLWEEI